MLKDLEAVQAFAVAQRLPLPLAGLVSELHRSFVAAGLGPQDNAAIMRQFSAIATAERPGLPPGSTRRRNVIDNKSGRPSGPAGRSGKMAQDTALRFEGIVKSFGGVRALRGVSLAVGRGEIVALLGENGAGKSTLIKILGGIHRPDEGRVSIGGTPYRHRTGGRAGRQAVAFIHQDLGLVDWMTVAENMGLAQGFARAGRRGPIDWRAPRGGPPRRWPRSAATSIPRSGCRR